MMLIEPVFHEKFRISHNLKSVNMISFHPRDQGGH